MFVSFCNLRITLCMCDLGTYLKSCRKKIKGRQSFFFSGFFTQLYKLRSLRRSFLHFHFPQFIYDLLHISLTLISFTGTYDFIAQLVEHRTGNREVTGSNPVEVLNFFSGFFPQLHKLCSLRRSFLHFH